MAGSFAALYYHLVFSTKDRRPWLTPDIAPRVHEYLGGVMRGIGGISLIVGGAEDHAHILGTIDKNIAVAAALRDVKADSSGWIHKTFPHLRQFAWQEGYGAFSISVSGLDRVKRYIEQQEKHHRTVTFQDEFRDFLRRHHIEFDENLIWL
ncbi:MAG: IS200/IS605 family transposase [Armatimonadota bacterium]